jgi:transcriptional regulator with XRE-family HTH domain
VPKVTPKPKEPPRIGRPLSCTTRLSELRLAKGWTRAELATRSGVPLRSLTKYETGKGKPYGDNRAKLVKTLGIEPEELR